MGDANDVVGFIDGMVVWYSSFLRKHVIGMSFATVV